MSSILIGTPLQGRSAIAKDDTEGDTEDRRNHEGSFCPSHRDSHPFVPRRRTSTETHLLPRYSPRDKPMFHRLHQLLSSYQRVSRCRLYTATGLDGSLVDVNGSKSPFT